MTRISEWVMGDGSFIIDLADVPRDILDGVAEWDHIAVTRSRLDVDRFDDAAIKAAAIWAGVVLTVPHTTGSAGDPVEISGVGLSLHLGDPDGIGDVFETAVELEGATFAESIRAVLPAGGSITEGTLGSASGTFTGSFQWVTPREAIEYLCQTFSGVGANGTIEWRVNADGTLDAGKLADLYVTDPAAATTPAVMWRGPGGAAGGAVTPADRFTGGTDDSLRVLRQVVVVGDPDDPVTGDDDASHSLVDYHGNALVRTAVDSEPDTTEANAGPRATALLDESSTKKRYVAASVATGWRLAGDWVLGDWVLGYSRQAALVGTADLSVGGDRIWPMPIRAAGVDWSPEPGAGIYHRAADGEWVDVTPWVVLTGSEPMRVMLGDRPPRVVENLGGTITKWQLSPDAVAPNPVTDLVVAGGAYVSPRGRDRGLLDISWTAPTLKVDGATLSDLAGFAIRIREVGSSEWSRSHVDGDVTSTRIRNLDPDETYDIEVRAIRVRGGYRSTWVADAGTPADDSTSPDTPPTPSLTVETPGRVTVSIDLSSVTAETTPDEYGESNQDIRKFVVYWATSAAPTAYRRKSIPVEWTDLAQGRIVSESWRLNDVELGGTVYVRLKAVDTSNNWSDYSAEAPILGSNVKDIVAPKPVTGLTATPYVVLDRGDRVGRIEVEWTDPTENDDVDDTPLNDLSRIRVAARVTGSGDKWFARTADPGDGEAVFHGIPAHDATGAALVYDVKVSAIDVAGNPSDWESTTADLEDLTAPTTPPTPVIDSYHHGKLRVSIDLSSGSWGASNPDVRGFFVYWGTSTSPTTVKAGSFIPVTYDELVGGETVSREYGLTDNEFMSTIYVRVKAADTGRNKSGYSAEDSLSGLAALIREDAMLPGSVDNLIREGGAELGDSDLSPHAFGAGGSTGWSASATYAHSGGYAFRFNTTGQTATGYADFNGSRTKPNKHAQVEEGHRYVATAWARGQAGATYGTTALKLSWYTAAGVFISSSTTTAVLTTAFQRFAVTGEAPATASYVVARWQVNYSVSSTGHSQWVDDVTLRAGIYAEHIVVDSLEALAANMGALTVDDVIDMLGSGLIRTSASGQRIEIVGYGSDAIYWYSGAVNETVAAVMAARAEIVGGDPYFYIRGPSVSGVTGDDLVFTPSGIGVSQKAFYAPGVVPGTGSQYGNLPLHQSKDLGLPTTGTWRRVYSDEIRDAGDNVAMVSADGPVIRKVTTGTPHTWAGAGGWEVAATADTGITPGYPVDVRAFASAGYLYNNASSNLVRVRCGISVDGGSTWSHSYQAYDYVGNLASAHRRFRLSFPKVLENVTPSGDVQAVVEVYTSTTAVTCENFYVDVDVVPRAGR